MLGMVPDLSVADERALARPDVQALVTTMTAEAFRQEASAPSVLTYGSRRCLGPTDSNPLVYRSTCGTVATTPSSDANRPESSQAPPLQSAPAPR